MTVKDFSLFAFIYLPGLMPPECIHYFKRFQNEIQFSAFSNFGDTGAIHWDGEVQMKQFGQVGVGQMSWRCQRSIQVECWPDSWCLEEESRLKMRKSKSTFFFFFHKIKKIYERTQDRSSQTLFNMLQNYLEHLVKYKLQGPTPPASRFNRSEVRPKNVHFSEIPRVTVLLFGGPSRRTASL